MAEGIVNVGIIGAGMIGGLHARNLARHTPGARVVGVMDIDETKAKATAAECDGAHVYNDADALIKAPDVDAILIASPDAFHAEQALACIAAGKPALCEKPMASNRADAERILQAELDCGRRMIQVGFMREYDRAHIDLLSILRRGDIGKVLGFRGIHINPDRGYVNTIDEAIVSSMIHDIHSARFMMGVEISGLQVQWVRAVPEQNRSARYAIVLLNFADGAIGTLEWSGASGYGYEVEVEITGETGAVSTNGSISPLVRRTGRLSQEVAADWPQRFAQAYLDEAEAWIASILTGRPTGPSAWDGCMSLVVAEACLRASRSGQAETIIGMERPPLYDSA